MKLGNLVAIKYRRMGFTGPAGRQKEIEKIYSTIGIIDDIIDSEKHGKTYRFNCGDTIKEDEILGFKVLVE